MSPFLEKFISILLSVLVIFFLLKRYHHALTYNTRFWNYISTISYSLAAIGSSILLGVLLNHFLADTNIFSKAFLHSAFIEEFTKLIFLYFLLRGNKINEVLYDGVYYGVILGAFYGFAENFFYSFDLSFWPLVLRSLTSILIHTINGGILGFYLLCSFFTEGKYKQEFIMKGFLFCLFIHGFYNYFGLLSGIYISIMPFLIIVGYVLLEIFISYAQGSLPKSILDLSKLNLVQYEWIKSFYKFELWFYHEQKGKKKYIDLFKEITKNKIKIILVLYSISLLFSFYLFYNKEGIKYIFIDIQIHEYISIFIIYPFVVSMIILFTGLINPQFLQKKVLKVPFICLITIKDNLKKEEGILFYLSNKGFYLLLENPNSFSKNIQMDFLIGTYKIKNILGRIVWTNENRNKKEEKKLNLKFQTSGAIIEFDSIPFGLIFYWNYKRIIHGAKNFYTSLIELR
jgi:hypothetical protein